MEASWKGRCGLADCPLKQCLGSSAVRQGRQSACRFLASTFESPCHSCVYYRGQGHPCTVASDRNVNPKASVAIRPITLIGGEEERSPGHSPLSPTAAGPWASSWARGAALLSCCPRPPHSGPRHCRLLSQSKRETKIEKHTAEIKNENCLSQWGRKAVTDRL